MRRPIADEVSADPSVVRFPHPARDWATTRGKRLCVCVKALRKMGQKKSKPSGPMGGVMPSARLPPIPPDSPLGLMIKNWSDSPFRRGKDKVKMIHYCVEVWEGRQIIGPYLGRLKTGFVKP